MWARNAFEQPAPSARTRIGTPCRCASGICASAGVQDGDVVGGGVRAGVARPQQPGQELPGVVQEAQDAGGSRTCLQRRRRLLLLRVADHDRGVDVQHQPGQLDPGRRRRRHRACRCLRALRPGDLPGRRPRRGDRGQLRRVELGQQPPHGRSPTPPARTGPAGRQHGDVGDALRTVGDRDRQIDQHPPRIMHRPRPAQPRQHRRQPRRSACVRSARSASSRDPACETTPRPSADTSQRRTSGSLHLESAFPCGGSGPSASPESPTGQALSSSPRRTPPKIMKSRG